MSEPKPIEGKPRKRGAKPGEAKGNAGKGRVKGTPNKSTAVAREAIARFVDGNTERLQEWLDLIAKDDPKDAFGCLMAVMEYHVPKLARTEVTGKDGGPQEIRQIVVMADDGKP